MIWHASGAREYLSGNRRWQVRVSADGRACLSQLTQDGERVQSKLLCRSMAAAFRAAQTHEQREVRP